jgi:hypothetical protein
MMWSIDLYWIFFKLRKDSISKPNLVYNTLQVYYSHYKYL